MVINREYTIYLYYKFVVFQGNMVWFQTGYAGYPAGRILGAGYTGYIKYSNNKFLLQYWEINLGYEKKM